MKKSLATALVLVAFVIGGAPAFAQSFSPEMGTGNVLPYYRGMETPVPEARGLYNYAPQAVKPVKRQRSRVSH